MVKPPKTESQKIGEELAEEKETYGLYDKAKLDIYNKKEEGETYLEDINRKDIPSGRKEIPYMYYGPAFRACVMNLYGKLKYKIRYINNPDGKPKYAKLYELDDYQFQNTDPSKNKDLDKMTFAEANRYFDMMRSFIEDIGITRFEIEKLSVPEKILRDAFSSD